jgi:hypothetical protein
MSNEAAPAAPDSSANDFTPPEKHKAADRAGKTLGNMAGSINRALGAEDEPVVLNRKGPHTSIKDLEDLIDKALEDAQSSPDN